MYQDNFINVKKQKEKYQERVKILECEIQLLKENYCRVGFNNSNKDKDKERGSEKYLDIDKSYNSDKQKLNVSNRNKQKKTEEITNEKKENIAPVQTTMSKKFIDSDLKHQTAARSKKFSKNSVIVKK